MIGVERGEPSSAGLREQRIHTEARKTPEAPALGTEWTGPEEGEVPQNDRPQQRDHWGPQVKHSSLVQLYCG